MAGITQKWLRTGLSDGVNGFDDMEIYCLNNRYVMRLTLCSAINEPNIIDIPLSGTCEPFSLSGTLESVETSCCDETDISGTVVAA